MPEGAMMADDLQPPVDGAVADTNDSATNDVAVTNDSQVDATARDDDSEAPTAEELASELGWCPKEAWRGDPEEWKPAGTFLKSTVDINKRLSRDLKATREASERAARAAASITERAVEGERQRLLQQRREAFEAGDGQAFTQVEQRLATLPQSVPVQSGETQEFVERNAGWYGKHKEATQLAYAKCEELAARGVPQQQQLVLAEHEVKRAYPELFRSTQTTKGPAQVDTGQARATATARKGPKGFNDLPPDAKKAALDFEKRGRATKDEYAKFFWEENA